MPRWLGLAPAHSRNCRAESLSQSILETSAPLSMAVEKGAKTAVVWLLFTLPLSLLEGVFSQNGPQRSRARRCCAAKRTLNGEDRSEILDKRERGGPKWTAKMAQSLTASDTAAGLASLRQAFGIVCDGHHPYMFAVGRPERRANRGHPELQSGEPPRLWQLPPTCLIEIGRAHV